MDGKGATESEDRDQADARVAVAERGDHPADRRGAASRSAKPSPPVSRVSITPRRGRPAAGDERLCRRGRPDALRASGHGAMIAACERFPPTGCLSP